MRHPAGVQLRGSGPDDGTSAGRIDVLPYAVMTGSKWRRERWRTRLLTIEERRLRYCSSEMKGGTEAFPGLLGDGHSRIEKFENSTQVGFRRSLRGTRATQRICAITVGPHLLGIKPTNRIDES